MRTRRGLILWLIALVLTVAWCIFTVVKAEAKPNIGTAAHAKGSYEYKVRTAPVSYNWQPILDYYTGSYYGVEQVNLLWRHAPRNKDVLDACKRWHVPYRLLLGVWGQESGYGRGGSNNFGLIGITLGTFRHQAFYSAHLFSKFYYNTYHRRAVT